MAINRIQVGAEWVEVADLSDFTGRDAMQVRKIGVCGAPPTRSEARPAAAAEGRFLPHGAAMTSRSADFFPCIDADADGLRCWARCEYGRTELVVGG